MVAASMAVHAITQKARLALPEAIAHGPRHVVRAGAGSHRRRRRQPRLLGGHLKGRAACVAPPTHPPLAAPLAILAQALHAWPAAICARARLRGRLPVAHEMIHMVAASMAVHAITQKARLALPEAIAHGPRHVVRAGAGSHRRRRRQPRLLGGHLKGTCGILVQWPISTTHRSMILRVSGRSEKST